MTSNGGRHPTRGALATAQERRLALWANRQRCARRARASPLAARRVALLEDLPGWRWHVQGAPRVAQGAQHTQRRVFILVPPRHPRRTWRAKHWRILDRCCRARGCNGANGPRTLARLAWRRAGVSAAERHALPSPCGGGAIDRAPHTGARYPTSVVWLNCGGTRIIVSSTGNKAPPTVSLWSRTQPPPFQFRRSRSTCAGLSARAATPSLALEPTGIAEAWDTEQLAR